jgi:hypothetical protein
VKHIIRRLSLKRNFELYPDTAEGHRNFWHSVEVFAEETKENIEQRDCIVCEWQDFPIFAERHLVTEWIIEIEEIPQKKETSFGTLLFYQDTIKLDNFGKIEYCTIEEAEHFLEQDIIETKAWIQHLEKLKLNSQY